MRRVPEGRHRPLPGAGRARLPCAPGQRSSGSQDVHTNPRSGLGGRGGAWDSAFLTDSQVLPALLVYGPHFPRQGLAWERSLREDHGPGSPSSGEPLRQEQQRKPRSGKFKRLTQGAHLVDAMPGSPSARVFRGSRDSPRDSGDVVLYLARSMGPDFAFTISNPDNLEKEGH